MKIKDISRFRTNWKEKEGFSGFNENFIGTTYNGVNGFYRIVNGTVHDIKADLTPKLQNAQDEQAIYEFLQNAADSNSSNCAVIYDEEYFMVINNGIPFSVKDVEAILNSFQGTKADKSQNHNCDKIGRYGIGFKLVHRLVGKSDGAKELIENLDGPVIFSWFDKDQFNDFVLTESHQDFLHDAELNERASPWLFKISLTCFPTMPGETVKGLNYTDTIVYSNEELNSLQTFLLKHKTRIDELNLDKGSLFFLKFGENKHQKLEESLRNISSGIGYSLNTLKTLETVILQEDIVTRIPIERIDVKILPSEDAFKIIDPEFSECPIDLMFGYRTDEFETLRNGPNIYQFFPMRNESHGLSFFIHASSFAKVTDRTKLDDQGESNIRTFQFLSKRIKELLKEEFQIKNKVKARDIFRAIIFSEISQRQNSQLVVTEFLMPLIHYFEENVPSRNDEFLPNGDVLIKGTGLDINPPDFGIDKQWFYWNNEDNKELINESRKAEKLDLEKWNIAKLIENSNISAVNVWIRNAVDSELTLFIQEIEKNIPKKNFFDIQFLKCTDGEFYSINDIAAVADIIVLFDKIVDIADTLKKLDLITTVLNLSAYENIISEASEEISYLGVLNEKSVFDDFIKPATLENALTYLEKKKLFLAVRELYNIGPKSLKEWELFKSSENGIKPLGELITNKINVEPWLCKYQISTDEYFEDLDEYLVQQEEIFPSIIYSKWEEIIDNHNFNANTIESFYSAIGNYYDDDLHKGKSLINTRYIFTEDKFLKSGDVFYNNAFQSINNYPNLVSAIQRVTEFETPCHEILKYLSQLPFKTENDNLLSHIIDAELEFDEAYELLRYCQRTELNIFNKATFSENGGNVKLTTGSNKIQYWSNDENLIKFIEEHLVDSFVLLPSDFTDFKTLTGILQKQELFKKIISAVPNIHDLAEDFLPLLNDKETVRLFILGLDEIWLNSENKITIESFEYLFISKIFQFFDDDHFEAIKAKFRIEANDIVFKLSEINSSNEIQFEFNDKIYSLKVSEILPDSDNFAKTKSLETLISKLKKLELPITKIDLLLSIDVEEEDLIQKIAEDLPESITDRILQTSEQVAFVLFYEAKFGWTNFKDFKLYAMTDTTFSINDLWYLNKYSFLVDGAIVSDKYHGLSKILKIKDSHPIFKISDECSVILRPTFDEEGAFKCSHLSTNLNYKSCTEFFDFLFEEYQKRGRESKRDFEGIADWSMLGDVETKTIIGFDPQATVLFDNSEYVFESEKAPEWLFEWANLDDKKAFLRVLGIHVGDSDIIRMRQSFRNESNFTADEFGDSEAMNEQLLDNTFEWLCEFDWEGEYIDDVEKVELLNAVVSKLGWNEEDYWSIDLEKLNKESKEWVDINYDRWRDETDSFEVRLLNAEIPYKFEYNEQKIALKNFGDFWYDKEENIFYCNSEKSTLLMLQMAAEDGILNGDIIKTITNQGLARVKELEEENQKLKTLVLNNGSASKHEKSENDIPMSNDLLDNTDEKTRIAISKEAQEKIFSVLITKGFKITANSEIRYTIADGVTHPNGTSIKIVTKSAKGGTIYFNPSEWLALCEDDSQLFVVSGNGNVINVTIDDLISNNDKFHLRFNTEAFAGKANFKAFAQMVKYLPETHFLFKSPMSTADFFKEFGLNERNPSSLELTADDMNLLH